MIEIKPFKKSKKSPVYIDVAGSNQKYDYIRLKEELKLNPSELFRIETNLTVKCTEECDECWVHGGIDCDNTLEEFPNVTSSERYTSFSEGGEIVIVGYNISDKVITLPKDTDVARLFYSCMEHNDRVYDASKEINTNAIFDDDYIAVFSRDGKGKNVEYNINPETGEHFWVITEDNNE